MRPNSFERKKNKAYPIFGFKPLKSEVKARVLAILLDSLSTKAPVHCLPDCQTSDHWTSEDILIHDLIQIAVAPIMTQTDSSKKHKKS